MFHGVEGAVLVETVPSLDTKRVEGKDSGAGQYRNNSSRYDFPDPFHLCSLSMSSFIVLHLCSDTIFQYLADLDISRNAS